MARQRTWSDAELAELAAIEPRAKGAAIRFHADHPHHSLHAIRSKLQVLRQRGKATDVAHAPDDPFPAYRFG